jgi:hypothetical protein
VDYEEQEHFIDYIVSGGGGRSLYEMDPDSVDEINGLGYDAFFFNYDYGVVTLDFSPENIVAEYYAPNDNQELDHIYTVTRPQQRK